MHTKFALLGLIAVPALAAPAAPTSTSTKNETAPSSTAAVAINDNTNFGLKDDPDLVDPLMDLWPGDKGTAPAVDTTIHC
jgi:hypothetical protein